MGFEASYAGWCPDCDSDIRPGQQIEPVSSNEDGITYRHVTCPTPPRDSTKPCPDCFLIHAGACF